MAVSTTSDVRKCQTILAQCTVLLNYVAGLIHVLNVETVLLGVPVVATTGSGNSLIIQAAPGKCYKARAVNLSSVTGWLLLLDSATVPADGASVTPIGVARLLANSEVTIDYSAAPALVQNGVVAVLSNAPTPFTLGLSSPLTGYINGQAALTP